MPPTRDVALRLAKTAPHGLRKLPRLACANDRLASLAQAGKSLAGAGLHPGGKLRVKVGDTPLDRQKASAARLLTCREAKAERVLLPQGSGKFRRIFARPPQGVLQHSGSGTLPPGTGEVGFDGVQGREARP